MRDFHTPGSSVVIIQSRVLARVAKSAESDMSSPRTANGSLGTWLALAYLELSYRQWLELNTLESSLGVRGGFCRFCLFSHIPKSAIAHKPHHTRQPSELSSQSEGAVGSEGSEGGCVSLTKN